MRGATLFGAHLERANLGLAHLAGADLTGAHLERAYLYAAQALTQEQLEVADGDAATALPAGLTRPAHWTTTAPQ